eukprot:scaffold2768_cov161-Amphora_coffeaeformis.AAC.4
MPLKTLVVLLFAIILMGGPGVGAAFQPPLQHIHQGRKSVSFSPVSPKPQAKARQTLAIRGGGSKMVAPMAAVVVSKSGLLASWAIALGGFLIRNYKATKPWPSILLTGSRRGWNFVHAVSSTIFSGTILVTTLLEWLVVRSASPTVIKFWFLTIPRIDVAIVLPALTGAVVSGVAQSVQEYGTVKEAPKYIKSVLHLMATFGLWWAATDRPTQRQARQAVQLWLENKASGPVPSILQWRRGSNLVSCSFVLVLYILMVLKPGRPDLPPIR